MCFEPFSPKSSANFGMQYRLGKSDWIKELAMVVSEAGGKLYVVFQRLDDWGRRSGKLEIHWLDPWKEVEKQLVDKVRCGRRARGGTVEAEADNQVSRGGRQYSQSHSQQQPC